MFWFWADYGMPAIAAEAALRQARADVERVKILQEGITLTAGERDEEYGPPYPNFACAGELKAVLRKYATRDVSPAEYQALDMVLTKISRIVTGKAKRDNYVDGATYLAIAGELALDNLSVK